MRLHILRHLPRRLALAAPLLVVMLLVSACASTATVTVGGTPGSGTATPSHAGATATPASAPPHALAWIQHDSAHMPQIWASVNGGSAHQVTHFPAPADGCDPSTWGLPVFSPDLTHIASVLGYICGDGPSRGTVEIINASTGTYTDVPGSETTTNANDRTYGWLNNSTIWIVNAGGLYQYTLGAGSATALPGFPGAFEGEMRGSTFFYDMVSYNSGTLTFSTTLHRYDMNSHTVLAGSISLGSVKNCECSSGDSPFQGWDASPDGAHVAYQVTTAGPGPDFGIAHSTIYYANANGSGASQIASFMVTTGLVQMAISPNGHLAAFTNATPSPTVISASVTSPGLAGDPDFHAYSPDAGGYPAWKWDSSQFWATSASDLRNYVVGTAAGVSGAPEGGNPWYTIGS